MTNREGHQKGGGDKGGCLERDVALELKVGDSHGNQGTPSPAPQTQLQVPLYLVPSLGVSTLCPTQAAPPRQLDWQVGSREVPLRDAGGLGPRGSSPACPLHATMLGGQAGTQAPGPWRHGF